jgi:hypothetical protein
MALTLVGVAGVLITTPDSGTQGTGLYTLLSLLMVIGFGLDIAVLIWACIVALRMGRWGWAAALFFGSAGLVVVTVFFLPAALIFVFALWGPNTPRASPTKTLSAPGYPMFAPSGTPYPGYPPGNMPSSGMPVRPPAPVGSLPYRPAQPPERPGGQTPQR